MLLDEYLQGDLTPNRLPPTWVSRTKFVFQSDDGSLAVYETTNNSVKTLVTNHTLVSFITTFHNGHIVTFFAAAVSFSSATLRSFIYHLYLQRQLNIKGYQCTTNLDFVLFKHNVKNVSITD